MEQLNFNRYDRRLIEQLIRSMDGMRDELERYNDQSDMSALEEIPGVVSVTFLVEQGKCAIETDLPPGSDMSEVIAAAKRIIGERYRVVTV